MVHFQLTPMNRFRSLVAAWHASFERSCSDTKFGPIDFLFKEYILEHPIIMHQNGIIPIVCLDPWSIQCLFKVGL